MTAYKVPESVLVVVHTAALEVLLLERADHPGYWQSVTGSREPGESLRQTAERELAEETGLDAATGELSDWAETSEFEIYAEWCARYAPGVTRNTEHRFGLLLAERRPVRPNPAEHLAWRWLPWREAAEAVFSWSNADAIRRLPELAAARQCRKGDGM